LVVNAVGCSGEVEEEGKGRTSFFVKKEAKKLFSICLVLVKRPETRVKKFFASFLQKRSAFLLLLFHPTAPRCQQLDPQARHRHGPARPEPQTETTPLRPSPPAWPP
jgi:hypothetical protein